MKLKDLKNMISDGVATDATHFTTKEIDTLKPYNVSYTLGVYGKNGALIVSEKGNYVITNRNSLLFYI